MIKKLIYLLFVPLCCYSVKAQNLVPNGSFEEYYQLPTTQGQINYAKHWFSATASTPDYFSRLADTNCVCNVPNANTGFQDAFSGDAFSGIFIYDKANPNNLEYIETKLTTPLISQKCYTLSFYVSLAENLSCYTVNNIGAYFSQDSLYINQFIRLSQYTPQVVNSSINPLSDTLGWTKITQSFFAEGGESYLVIGNFNSFSNDDTTRTNNLLCTYGYIYIDSVTVRKCGETTTEESVAEKIKVYPNPANTYLTANIGKLQNAQVELFDISGRKLLQQNLNSNNDLIDISSFSNGVYICIITSNNQVVKREKIIISR